MRTTTIAILFALAVLMLPGCNTAELPFAKAKARKMAAEIKQKQAELVELKAEAIEAAAAAEAEPTPDNVDKAEAAKNALQDKARETGRQIVDLEGLLQAIENSESIVAKTTAQLTEATKFLPLPFQSIALLVIGMGATWLKGRSTAKVLAGEARSEGYAEAEEIGMSAIRAVDEVLTPELKARISQGDATKALVNKAQGKI